MENASSSSSASPTGTLLIEEREEVMVSEKDLSLRKTHFLKPFVTSIDGSVAELPRERLSVSPSDLKRLSTRISFSGFWFVERHFVSWLGKMQALHEPTWRKAGISEAIKASTYNITKNPSLILSVAEKWCPETKSFVFPWGEATITLEDVMVLLGFSVLGSPAFAPLESSEMRAAEEKLEKVRLKRRRPVGHVSMDSWISSFRNRDDEMEHEAFLVLWLSFFVFPNRSRRDISKNVIPIAVRLARGERTALAPVVLANLYKDLGRIHCYLRDKCDEQINLKSLFKLVQVWIWERFRKTRPNAREIPKGEPRMARWDYLPQKSKKVRLNLDDFDWRPYTKPLKNWNPLRFYVEEAMWVAIDDRLDDEFASFARCVTVSQLSGDGFVEDYFPNRVAMQFGLAQDLPGLVNHHRIFTDKEAWRHYNRSLHGLKLYIPSRLAQGSVTARYRDWWLNSVSEFPSSKEMKRDSTKTFNARNALDDESSMDEDDDDDDDYMTIAQRIKSMKRHGDAEKTVGYGVEEKAGGDASKSHGKRSRKYQVVDSDDSRTYHKLDSSIIEHWSEDDDETTSKAQRKRLIVGNTAEKKSNRSDGTKKAACLLDEAGEKQRCNEKLCSEDDNIDERLRKKKIAIEELAQKLEERMIKEKKSLAEIRKWLTRRNLIINGDST